MTAMRTSACERVFDGVICFGGEDWWYHNRGHYDMQMMRELSKRVPVLYVNSIGMRTPRPGEGAMFFRRVARKLASLRRGLAQVDARFWVFSPVAAPGGLGKRFNPRLLPLQVKRAARRLGIKRPLVWVACPPAVEALERIDAAGMVYQRTDRYEEFEDVDGALIGSYDRALKELADVTLFCASLLMQREGASCRRAAFVDHGVDASRFAAAGDDPSTEPEDMAGLPRPRVGFIGDADPSTFDPAFYFDVVERAPGIHFALIGPCSLGDAWRDMPNVSWHGQKPFEQVAAYMAACDVLIMPWRRSEWIEACNPVKLKEYLAVGRPVVTTPFHELKHYEGLVRIASTPEAFAAAIESALREGCDVESMRRRVTGQTWSDKAAAALSALREAGVAMEGDTRSARRRGGAAAAMAQEAAA